ncbi:MAG: O-antigen ligase family protein [Verrucomicrobiota bacterium]|nr:O-antigen ligase family protein [Verrucomicrobiota bacterium]
MPNMLLAVNNTGKIRNFTKVSSQNPYFPILLLIAMSIALITFFKPKIGLFVMLFFFLISTDMPLGGEESGRSTTIRIEDIILLLVSGGWLLNRAKTRTLGYIKRVPINKSIFYMICIILLATVLGYLQGFVPLRRGILFSMKRLEYFWIFFMTLNTLSEAKETQRAFNLLLGVTAFVAVVGIIQFFLFPFSQLTGGGATSTTGFGRANTLADFYLLLTGITLGLTIYTTKTKKRLLYLGLLFLCLTAILMTKSRGAYVSIPPLLFVIILISKSKKTLLTLFVLCLCFLFYQTSILLFKVQGGAGRLIEKHRDDMSQQFNSIGNVIKEGPRGDSSFYARYSAWENSLPEIVRHPVFGHGVGSKPLSFFDCHYVREAYETGLFGLLLFLYMNYIIFITVYALFKTTEVPHIKGLALGFIGGHLGMMVHGITIANFYTILNMEVFWLTVALLMILYHNELKAQLSTNALNNSEKEMESSQNKQLEEIKISST